MTRARRKVAKPVEPRRYTKQQRDRATVEHMALVDRIVAKLVLRLPKQINADELRSAGWVGLCESAHAFDKNRNVAFGAFARQRIYGAMLDFLRTLDMRTRNERAACKNGDALFFEIQLHNDNPHLEEDIDNVIPSSDSAADVLLIKSLESQHLKSLLDRLMPRERYVLVQLFWHERTSVDIGDDLGIKQARVSQLKQRAIGKLRSWLTV